MRKQSVFLLIAAILIINLIQERALAWDDETHLSVAKAVGYKKWYNVTGPDMAKLKAGNVEGHNHYAFNASGTHITVEKVLGQIAKYNQIDGKGHLYGAIIASVRDYKENIHKGKYGQYHLSYCAHYVGDLSHPFHNITNTDSNRKYHRQIDGVIEKEVLNSLGKIKIYHIEIDSETKLAQEIARIANLGIKLGYKIQKEKRKLTPKEAYGQLSHSASLLRGILNYLGYYESAG